MNTAREPLFEALRAAMSRAIEAGDEPSDAAAACNAVIFSFGPGVFKLAPKDYEACALALGRLYQTEDKTA